MPELQHHPLNVEVEGFEGPLDLLLHLCERQRLDITLVSLVAVTGPFLAYLRAAEQIDHWALADFVAIGARLIELKSRALLPAPPQPPEEEDERLGDDLIEMLRQYQRFKELAAYLRGREEGNTRAFTRLAPPPDVPLLPGLGDTTPARLLAILQRVIARSLPLPEPELYLLPRLTVRERMAQIALELRIAGSLSFGELLGRCRTREEVVTAFFAVLDLIRARTLDAMQTTPFGEIMLIAVASTEDMGGGANEPLEAELAGVEYA